MRVGLKQSKFCEVTNLACGEKSVQSNVVERCFETASLKVCPSHGACVSTSMMFFDV